MFAGSNGLPDPATRQPFINEAANPVDIQVGPGGDLYYVDFDGGTIRRVRSLAGNHAPNANAAATPTSGQAPLTVNFDGSGSTDPDNDALSYAWDLDGDGAFDDSTAAQASFTYTQTGSFQARLRVRDPSGLEDIDTVTITVGAPPTPTIATPVAGTTWAVDDEISFSGSATRAGGGVGTGQRAELDGHPQPLLGARPDELPRARDRDLPRHHRDRSTRLTTRTRPTCRSS